VTLNFRNVDVVQEVMKLTGGKGADSSIEALGTQATFAQAMKVLRPGGTLSAWGVFGGPVHPHRAVRRRPGRPHHPHRAVPGGKERMRRLMNVIASSRWIGRAGHAPAPAGRHRGRLRPVRHQRDGVLKIAIKP
jgi:threonine dehydrogenase-like Zn-dependent dehydrogenase